MPIDPYTHDFRFEIGGQFIRGEVEFDTDKKMSFSMKEWSTPLDADNLEKFNKFMDLLKIFFEGVGEIKVIGVRQKEDANWKTPKEIEIENSKKEL